MLSRVQYELFRKSIRFSMDVPREDADEFYDSPFEAQAAWDIMHPYVVVVHRPTGHGYFLDRKYLLIFCVKDIPVPTEWVERELKHRPCSQSEIPFFHESLFNSDDFDSYWLY